jgi:hypothetical protein
MNNEQLIMNNWKAGNSINKIVVYIFKRVINDSVSTKLAFGLHLDYLC